LINNKDLLQSMLQSLPIHVQSKILFFLSYKEYTLTSRTSKHFKSIWKDTTDKHLLPLYIPQDFTTLQLAVERIEQDLDHKITTIVLGKGTHNVNYSAKGKILHIKTSMNIIGQPNVHRSDIIVFGGFWIESDIENNTHLQHMTISQSEGHGVFGASPFTMNDILVTTTKRHGVCAYDVGGRAVCTDVEVCQCRQSGMVASNGGSITIMGTKTTCTVHDNCKRHKYDYGLQVSSRGSKIYLISPLTKEIVSINNGGGGNYGVSHGGSGDGDIDQIKTVSDIGVIRIKMKKIM